MTTYLPAQQSRQPLSGKLYKGPVKSPLSLHSLSSAQTTREQGFSTHEKRSGFGTVSTRFPSKFAKSSPGPGAFSDCSPTKSPSFSRKGFGGLVSVQDRFKRFQFITASPGPGKYSTTLKATSPTSVRYRPPIPIKQREIVDTPSPAQYSPHSSQPPKQTCHPFNSSAPKHANVASHTPAPWQYSVNSGLCTPKKASMTYHLPLHPSKTPKESPGPGQYSTEHTAKKAGLQPSYMFLESNLDRFGLSFSGKRETLPGPGAYNLPAMTLNKTPSYVFISETSRISNSKNKKPGPAFYTPLEIPRRTSFHLKNHKVWF